jgi:hypothetical protein
MAATKRWAAREERRGEKKGTGSNGITSGHWQVGTLDAFCCVRCPHSVPLVTKIALVR